MILLAIPLMALIMTAVAASVDFGFHGRASAAATLIILIRSMAGTQRRRLASALSKSGQTSENAVNKGFPRPSVMVSLALKDALPFVMRFLEFAAGIDWSAERIFQPGYRRKASERNSLSTLPLAPALTHRRFIAELARGCREKGISMEVFDSGSTSFEALVFRDIKKDYAVRFTITRQSDVSVAVMSNVVGFLRRLSDQPQSLPLAFAVSDILVSIFIQREPSEGVGMPPRR